MNYFINFYIMYNKLIKYKNKLSNYQITHYPKVAVCFYGLCRSTNYTIESINNCIFKPLKQLNFNYHIYLHTFNVTTPYTNARNNEENIMLDNDLYKLLNPMFYKIDDQDNIKKSIDFLKYRTNGDPWLNDFKSLDNLILGLYSLNQITQLWKNNCNTYDYIIYLRPDVKFINPLQLSFFSELNNSNIALPDFHEYPINDRFAIGKPNVMLLYGERYLRAYDYSLINKLHAETYLNYILEKNKIDIIKIKFYFQRIRANGFNYDENMLLSYSYIIKDYLFTK
jgi:hypothetical protein